ncbi:pentatricopeptide repeat-containing protein At1g77170, mitochondrial-like [Argentina anserina]|uniref:pentatricopeptide repeat-containing protein At1g77170, mitochondrial-like n=1 Tax=Argentina anserina TaxID=57926 RepID=UPI002176380E|nr:pentatricopeptide repeat-containing protein At1g77170, mitochondrial-like [Potentilla anserina]
MRLKVGRFSVAQKLFDEMRVRDVVSWNTGVSGYCVSGEVARLVRLGGCLAAWLARLFSWPSRNERCAEAVGMFREMQECGLAMNGHADEASECFVGMIEHGLVPNEITFMGLLTACTHAGLVHKGLEYYDMMERIYEISPKIEHYGCVVDLLSCAGRLASCQSTEYDQFHAYEA